LNPNVLLSNLFSNILNLCSPLNVRDQVSHPCKTTGKITALLYFKFYLFWLRMEKQKIPNSMAATLENSKLEPFYEAYWIIK
jgi:hypothetical protein